MTNASTYERAKRLANYTLFAVSLQHRRLNGAEPEDSTFVFRTWYDFELLLVALIRLRRLAQQIAQLPEVAGALNDALTAFDAALPGLSRMRNVAEHVDDYAVGKGRLREIRPEMLEVSTIAPNGPTLTWLGADLNASEALTASEQLFREIQGVQPRLAART